MTPTLERARAPAVPEETHAAEADPRSPLLQPWTPPGGGAYWLALAVLGLLALGGSGALVVLTLSGPEPYPKWAYTAATLSFLLSTAQASPILILATRLRSGSWGAPLHRLAELGAVAGVVTAPGFVLLLWQLPDWRLRPSLWFDWPGAPLIWDSIAVVLLAVMGLALVHIAALPDFARMRDTGRGDPGALTRWRALGWRGTLRQWDVLRAGLALLGTLYFIGYVLVHLLFASDLGLSLIPRWNSAVMPVYHAVSGLQGGLALIVVAAAAVRRVLRAHHLSDAAFHGAGRMLLAFALIWFWLVWSEFITYWYGRLPDEQWLLALLMFGPNLPLFLTAFGLCCLLPAMLLLWGPGRKSIWGPTTAAALMLVGLLIDRIRVFGAAWSMAGPVLPREAPLPPLPALPLPGLLDLLVMAGLPAAVLFLALMALRWLPPLPLWELRAVELVTVRESLVRTRVTVVGKLT
jgi:hypothetical protein